MKAKETKVISFRVSSETANQIDKQAKKVKKKRAAFVESVFVDAFGQIVEGNKKTASAEIPA